MQMNGEQRIAAPCQKVWEALNDPAVLRESIPGCQSLDKETDERFTALVEVKVGPIGARFKGNVTLTDINAPHGYTLILEGNGGIAGSAKGKAKVTLSAADGGTLISYTVDAEVGGRMAQLGGPIIDATAKQLAATFFKRFGEVVSGTGTSTASAATTTTPTASSTRTTTAGSSPWMGLAIGLTMLLVAVAAFEYGKNSASPHVIVLDQQLLHDIMERHEHEQQLNHKHNVDDDETGDI